MTKVIMTEAEKVIGFSDPQLYLHTRSVADIIMGYGTSDPADFDSGKPWLIDQRDQKPILDLKQESTAGLFLSFVQRCPYALWTPWGQWHFCAAATDNFESVLPDLLQRFNAKMFRRVRIEDEVEFGPVYSLHSVDGIELPTPELNVYVIQVSTNLISDSWDRFTELWRLGRI